MPRGVCRCMGCAGVKFSACGGPISICALGRSPSISPGSWWSTGVRIEEPKSRNGKRTLPLDGELVAALTALRKCQLDESLAAGPVYRSVLGELEWYQGGEYVVTDEVGTPVHPVHGHEKVPVCGQV